MSDYTPSEGEVREYIANGGEYRPWEAPDADIEAARVAAFDRFLADDRRKTAARALREAADKWTQGAWASDLPPRGADRPALILGMSQRAGDFMRAEANRIEKGATDE